MVRRTENKVIGSVRKAGLCGGGLSVSVCRSVEKSQSLLALFQRENICRSSYLLEANDEWERSSSSSLCLTKRITRRHAPWMRSLFSGLYWQRFSVFFSLLWQRWNLEDSYLVAWFWQTAFYFCAKANVLPWCPCSLSPTTSLLNILPLWWKTGNSKVHSEALEWLTPKS